MRSIPTILAVMTIVISVYFNAAQAGEPKTSYFGLQYGIKSLDFDDSISTYEPTIVGARLGIYFTENFGVEARIASGAESDTNKGVELSIEKVVGLYGVYDFPLNQDNSIYTVLGYTSATVEFSIPGRSESSDERGGSFGLGYRYKALTIEAMRYLTRDDVTASALTVGFVVDFQ